MSITTELTVVGKTKEDVLNIVKNYRLGQEAEKIEGEYNEIYIAGFGFSVSEGTSRYYNDNDEECDYKTIRGLKDAHLSCTTYMGMGYYGEVRDLQINVTHMLAQYCSLILNCESMVYDPQSGKIIYYRRKDHPEIHKALNESGSFTGKDYNNFCEIRDGLHGEWETMGWERKRKEREKQKKEQSY